MSRDLVRCAAFVSPRTDPAASASCAQRGVTLLARLDAWLWCRRQRALERRLARCTDVADVERVLRDASLARSPQCFN